MKRPWYDLAFSGVDNEKVKLPSRHNNAHYNVVASWDFLNVQNEHIKEH